MTEGPEWFRRAVASPAISRTTQVQGAEIRYLSWGDPSHPGLLFVHGGGAHARWWSFVAPLLSDGWFCVALDLSGHGDSGRRELYTQETWANEVMGVVDDAGFGAPPVVVGHSLGGLVAIQTASSFGHLLGGAVIVDSPVRRPDPESEEGARGRAFQRPGTYPTIDEALAHFRLIPPQPVTHAWIVDHIARHSLREVDGGWTWKFDPRLFHHTMISMREQLLTVRCRVALLRGELSEVVTDDTARYMDRLLDAGAPVVAIPEARHHVMLDQPIAFVAALRALLAGWGHRPVG